MKRRSFLKTTLATTAYGVAPFNILRAGESPNSKLNVAIVGCGQQGSSNARSLQRAGANIVALCDVHASWCKAAIRNQKWLHGLKLWTDYRVMFDQIGTDVPNWPPFCFIENDRTHGNPIEHYGDLDLEMARKKLPQTGYIREFMA